MTEERGDDLTTVERQRPLPSQVLADNVRAFRLLRGLTQAELGDRLTELGHGWGAGTAGFVERGDRSVNVDELCGLAVALGVTLGQLLDPSGPDHSHRRSLDLGLYDLPDGVQSLGTWHAHLWVNSRLVIREWTSKETMDLTLEPAPSLHPLAERELGILAKQGQIRPLDQLREKGKL